ncbi:LexA family protein [Paenibacillus elgii]|uniref:LexA family protein n=1 Tax=Paenibacillus elgii TaxID=189691 RepID=UPI002D7EA8F8|nr:winged helix-turn-helix domain-containing protein [Paenibacillus elgii]
MNLEPNVRTEYFCDDERKAIMVYKYRAKECLFCSSKQQIIYFKKFYICMPCIQSLPALQVFLERLERGRADAAKKDISNKRKMTARRKEILDRLQQAMQENPKASQKELAEMLGISQGWVSQLLKKHADS